MEGRNSMDALDAIGGPGTASCHLVYAYLQVLYFLE